MSFDALEVEALEAIYSEKYERISENIVQIQFDTEMGPLYLEITFLDGYPLVRPKYEILVDWPLESVGHNAQYKIPSILASQIESVFDKTWDTYKGQVVVYAWAEELAQILSTFEDFPRRSDPELSPELPLESTDACVANEDPHLGTKNDSIVDSDAAPSLIVVNTASIPIIDRKSVFVGHVIAVNSVDQISLAIKSLLLDKKIAKATHNISASRIALTNGFTQDLCDDDGETAAGSRLLHLLQLLDVKNVLVVVSRWYGGILLGPTRFKHINNAARNVLKEYEFI